MSENDNITPSSSSAPQDEKLRFFWEQFLIAKPSTYEKSQWLDLFLSEYLTLTIKEEHNVKEVLKHLSPGLIGTSLSCELITDVHQICQQTSQQDDRKCLRNYLLNGRGTRTLLAFQSIGTQGISCGRELASLLISLYPICCQGSPDSTNNDNNPFLIIDNEDWDLTSENIFTTFIRSHKPWLSNHPRLSSGSCGSSTYKRKRTSISSVLQIQHQHSSESDVDLEMDNEISPVATLRIQLNPMDFDYFTSVIRSDDDDNFMERSRSSNTTTNKPDKFITDRLKPALHTKLNVSDLCWLLVSLIKKLCKSEANDCSCPTSLQATNFALENLCSLQFSNTIENCENLKHSFMHLLINALDKTLQQPDTVNTVIQTGIFPVLLRITEDSIRKSSSNQQSQQEFVYASIFVILKILTSLLKHNDKYKEFSDLLRLLSDSQGGDLIESAIQIIINEDRTKKLLLIIATMITNIKKIRAMLIHSKECKKHRHKQCAIPINERFHHLDRSQSYLNCNVSNLFTILLRIAQKNTNIDISSKAIRLLSQCGSCCCLPPRSLLMPMLDLIQRPDLTIRALSFTLLEKVLFNELGGSGTASSCTVCGSQVLNLLDADNTTDPGNIWLCLEQYKSILESQDHTLCLSIINHLFKVMSSASNIVKYSLLFKVFYPTLIEKKLQYFDNQDNENVKFLLESSLAVISSQLSNVNFAEEFITKGGLEHIFQLILLPNFSKISCSILEITVVVELWRNNGDNPSLNMLFKALDSSTLITNLQKLSYQQRRKIQLVDPLDPIGSDSGCLTEPTEDSDNIEMSTKDTLFEQLKSAVVYWKSCATLVTCSPEFRSALISYDLSIYKLLQLVTKQVVRGPNTAEEDYTRESEAFLFMRLFEALLTVCLGIDPILNEIGENNENEESLKEVKDALLGLKPQGRGHIQALCEVLLRCAATHYFESQVLPTRNKPELPVSPPPPMNNLHSPQIERDEVISLDDPYLTADEGYEADIELLEGNLENTKDKLLVGEDAVMSPFIAHQGQCSGGISAVSKPELCCLVLSLLVRLHEEQNGDESLNPGLAHTLQRLSALCRDSPHNCVTLARHGVIATLLSGFSDCLKSRDVINADLQRVVLDLVSLLARFSITSHELALYLNFFKAKDPPCEALLWPLVTLASHSKPQPHFILSFPAILSDEYTPYESKGEAESLALKVRKKHVEIGAPSSWSCAALALPINTQLGWSPWQHGFSIATWLRVECTKESIAVSRASSPRNSTVSDISETSDWSCLAGSSSHACSYTESMKSAQNCSENLIHIFSFCCDLLTIEVWIDVNNESIFLRLSRNLERSGGGYEILSEAATESGFITKSHWHHLAFDLKDCIENKRTTLLIKLIVNGSKSTDLKLSFNGLLVRKPRPVCILLGQTLSNKSSISGSWYLGSMMLFKSSILNLETSMRLAAMGPTITGLTDCNTNNSYLPNLVGLLSPKILKSFNWSSILDDDGCLNVLQENLFMTYNAQNSNLVQLYPNVVSSPGASMGSLFPSQAGFRVVTTDQRSCQQIPVSVSPVCFLGQGKAIESHYFKGLPASASLLGGVQVFLLLFARVVEVEESSEAEHAAALTLLLRLSHADSELYTQLYENHKLLLKVLESPKCKAGSIMLKAILDACCDRSLIPQTGGELAVNNSVDALVTNYFLLNTAVRAWRAWDATALNLLFQALHALLRDEHPNRDFNASQLNRARITDALLLFCKEKFLYEENCELPIFVSSSLVELIRSLMGSPPEFAHIVSITDFLLLFHRAIATCITDQTNNFYFYLPSNGGGLKLKRSQSNIDHVKLNKALANLQIKQNDNEIETESESIDSNKVDDDEEITIKNENNSPCSDDSGLPLYQQKYIEWEKFASETESNWQTSEKANAQFLIVEGLLLLVSDTLLCLPDYMTPQVLSHVVKPEIFLTMANHPDGKVRAAVIKFIYAYLQRASDEEINKFMKIKGFHLLANQLYQFDATSAVVESCAGLITHFIQLDLEKQTDIWSPHDLTSLQIASFPPFLAILPKCANDPVLCHNALYFLREVFSKVNEVHRALLLDNGLVEILAKTLQTVLHLPTCVNNVCGVSEQDLLIGDIHIFFVSIAGHFITTPGNQNMLIVCDILLKLGYFERIERRRCGWPTKCAISFRDAQCNILSGILDRIQERDLQVHIPPILLTSNFDGIDMPISAQQIMNLRGGLLKDFSKTEITERCKIILQKSVDFLLSAEVYGGRYQHSEAEMNFSQSIFELLINSLSMTFEKHRRVTTRTAWQNAIISSRELIRNLASQIIGWLLSPRHSLSTRIFVNKKLNNAPKCRELLLTLLQSNTQLEKRFHLNFCTMKNERALSLTDYRECDSLRGKLLTWDVTTSMGYINECNYDEEILIMNENIDKIRNKILQQTESAQSRCLQRQDILAKTIVESAQTVTRTAFEARSAEYKSFLEHMKFVHSEKVQIRSKWHSIITQLTHERAPWYFAESYPRSWEIDPTEGPNRVRNRLRRCHLGIKEKYLLPEYQEKIEASNVPQPFNFLFEKDNTKSTTIETLRSNEIINETFEANIVTPSTEIPGELLVSSYCLYFVPEKLDATPELQGYIALEFDQVREIHQRRYQLQERAIEIFLMNGKTYFLAFESSKQRDKVLHVLNQCNFPNLQAADTLADVLQSWREGFISNFEYLSQLNKMAGRSFNDLMQYPVFPFILADYINQKIDLHNANIYRNLRKPMAVQDKKNEQHYITTYNYLKQEISSALNQEPFHYGSHYSNSGTVLHFLVRLPPYTRMFLQYQDNNFDIPDRTFHSLHTTWRLTSSDSTTDVKELIPEFYFLPEFLLNSEGFNLGVRQSGEKVHDVILPSWCNNDPRNFILVHRQALESDFIRENLPHWIDLVFGFKQTGKPAVDAINVFHPATYYGFDVDSIQDPVERHAWKTMVRTYGQTPRQLFRTPHPMVVQSLTCKAVKTSVSLPLGGAVQNLKWGSYVGSPDEAEPYISWKNINKSPIAGLVPLKTNDVFGLAPSTSLILMHNGKAGMLGNPSVQGAALISWGFADGIIRAKVKKECPPKPLAQAPSCDPIILCASTPDVPQIWISLASGRILVLRLSLDAAKGTLDVIGPTCQLLGHEAPVHSLALCRSFSIAVSGSQDGTVIIWDINELHYIRSIPSVDNPIQLVAISDTSGDIITSNSNKDGGSSLRLYTINATLVGRVDCNEIITSLCFSCAPEGLSINVIAAGLSNGEIRMWNSWDLAPVRKIAFSTLNSAIISLIYSHDAQHLYAASADGTLIIWENSSSKGKTAKFMNLTSL